MPHLNEEQIKAAFVEAINRLITNKDAVLAAYRGIVGMLSDTSPLEAELEHLLEEAAVCSQLMRKSVDENARVALDQEEYQRRCGGYLERYEQASARSVAVKNEIAQRGAKKRKIGAFLKLIQQQQGLVQTFDEELWYATVQSVTVHSKEQVTFTFKSGEAIDGSM